MAAVPPENSPAQSASGALAREESLVVHSGAAASTGEDLPPDEHQHGQAHRYHKSPTLRASIIDAMWYFVMFGVGEQYLSAFAVHLGASPLQIGLLATLPPFLGACAQIIALSIIRFVPSRRTFIVGAVALQALTWLPIAIVPTLLRSGESACWALILFAVAYYFAGNLSAPIWQSLIGDLVPKEVRGHFFGYRNKKSGAVLVFAFISAGVVLHVLQEFGYAHAGFVGLFLLAGFARLKSAQWLARYDDPPFTSSRQHHFSFFQFLRRARRSNFAQFVFFFSLINCAAAVAGPYFPLYMLRELQFSYLEFSFLMVVQLGMQFITMQHWGMLGDRYGNRRLMLVSSSAVVLNPFMWLVSGDLLWLVFVQLYAGFAWAGFNIAAFNYLFDAVRPEKRAQCAAYMNVTNAFAVLVGAMVGGLLKEEVLRHTVPAIPGIWSAPSPFLTVFLFSGIFRLAVCLVFSKRFREVRDVQHISHRDLMYTLLPMRLLGWTTVGRWIETNPVKDYASKGSEIRPSESNSKK